MDVKTSEKIVIRTKFVVGFKTTDEKFKNLNSNFNCVLLAFGEENEEAVTAMEHLLDPLVLYLERTLC